MAAPRRWLLFALSLGSLVILSFAAISFAFSVPVSEEAAAAQRLPGQEEPTGEQRAVVVPVVQPGTISTIAGSGEGALVATADESTAFPAGATNVTIVRALAFFYPGANLTDENGTLRLRDVPGPVENGTFETFTVNASAIVPANATGFLVKADAETEARFVPTDRVVGEVVRFEDPTSTLMMFLWGGIGFLVPLVVLILTHRGAGRRGGAVQPFCRECRADMSTDATFCMRCGAWRDEA